MRTFTEQQIADGLAWLEAQPKDRFDSVDGFPDHTCTQGGYEQVAGFIATARAEGYRAGLEAAAQYLNDTGSLVAQEYADQVRALAKEGE